LTGNGLLGLNGSAPVIALARAGLGTVTAPINSATATSVSFVLPAGAVTGLFSVTSGSQTVHSATTLAVAASSDFALSVSPATSKLIPGQPTAVTVSPTSTNGFSGLANLSITGVPPGITAAFNPTTVSVGQVSLLTLTAPQGQSGLPISLVVNASANIDGQPVTHSAPLTIQVTGISTSFVGRTVVDDSSNTPIAGVTVTFLGVDATGRTTGCSGHTISDAAGNFSLTNLPASCVGPQLIAYNGSTATAPAGKYAGVNLSYTLAANQVTASPILIHLPRIDNANQVNVQQNASTDQMYAFPSIPGLVVIVYAGTTLSLDDGSQPNPFPLVAVQVPVDRLPDQMATSGMVMPFIVAFQPANAMASQPVAVNFPNSLNNAPGSPATLMTLDPTHGYMVPYGTATVSNNGTLIMADADPSHPGHNYGLVHFDWHGPASPPSTGGPKPGPGSCKFKDQCDPSPTGSPGPPGTPPCNPNGGPGSDCSQGQSPTGGDPVDLSSGLHVIKATDISISGKRGSISINRTYRGLTTNDGPFGLGGEFQYSWELDSSTPNSSAAINLISPDDNAYLFSRQADGTLTNSTVPWLQGAVMTTNSSNNQTSLRLYDGTVYTFNVYRAVSALVSVADSNGNTVQLTETIMGPNVRITQITDPVGRSLTLSYDSNAHATSVTDSIGRTVKYTYNSSGTLATVTNAAGGVTTMNYDSQNRLVSMVDPRNVTMFQDSFDANNRVASQTLADGSVITFSYVTLDPAPTSPIALATVTDGRGNPTTYRFNFQSFVIGVTDALGQTKTFARDPQTNNILQVTGSAQCPVCGPPGRGSMTYTYDAQGNRLTSSDALGNTTTYSYEPVFNKETSVTDALNHTTRYAYDGSGNLTKITDANGNITQYTYDSTGLLLTTTDALNNVTTITYDTFGNPATVTDALSHVTKFVYDPVSRPISITDPIGRTSSIGYDTLNRIVALKDGRGSFTQFNFDPVGKLLTLTDPKSNQTQFAYDPLSRLSARTSPLGKVESYQYDLAGNLIKYTDRRGQVSTYEYDTLNRLAQETYQDGAIVARSYDPYSRLLNVNDSVGGLFTFGYDINGSLLSQTSPTGVINYTRDVLHRVLTRQVIGQGAVTYSYDPVGNLLGAAMPSAGITYTYDARNMEKTALRTNHVNSVYTSDALGQVLSLVHSNGTMAINTQLYAYDASGNLTLATNGISQHLITAPTVASVDQANELLVNGTTSYTSDPNGNRLTEKSASGVITYTWDSRNRLVSIKDASGNVTSFKYDFQRNLIEIDRTTSGLPSAQKFATDLLTNVVSFTDSSGLPVSVITGWSVNSDIASVAFTGSVAFGVSDIRGSNIAVTDTQGQLSSTLDYEPYGQTSGSLTNDYIFTFTGQIPVTEHIISYRNRYYDTDTSRFLSEDPIGLAAGDSNFYGYVSNTPTSYLDPLGLAKVSRRASTSSPTPSPIGVTDNGSDNASHNEDNFNNNFDKINSDNGGNANGPNSTINNYTCSGLIVLSCGPTAPPPTPPLPCPRNTCCPANSNGSWWDRVFQ
jgi:RHS repeat-associated protein